MKNERLFDSILLKYNASAFHGNCPYFDSSKNYKAEALKYFEAFQKIGYDIFMDTNSSTSFTYTENIFTIDDGVRQNTAQIFLHPIKDRQNLYVLKNTLVSKILFDDDKNAIGVEAILENNQTIIVKADKEVIVSGGAINTPQLLMLSGIGPKEHLKDQNIDVISDLPVGQALQDHIKVIITHTMGNSTPAKPTIFPIPAIFGYLTLNKSQNYPDYQAFTLLMNEPTAMLQFCTFYYSFVDKICDALYNSSVGKPVLLTSHVLLYPNSRGKILLRSKDPRVQPLIYNGYYSDNVDLDMHARYIQDFLRVQYTKFFESVEADMIIPEVCGCGDFNSTHNYYNCYVLCMMVSGCHYAGSSPIGAVVDSHLKVFGVQRLRVADASIMPKIVGTNINAATIMIGEKAADFIKEDYIL
ncbi:hypothetical protein PYW08_005397 [Mythimna loreyi]|uniref:Uncharacterized protein n=1 Tax=Mythimna loreyi TaxID=667449 RepID=A0ACC2QH36_9NEOP|nr:hypothetical protein PYW08_005397 [Mythimna loreyi]